MFSIILATYNGEKYIKQQIDSILNQDYKDFELLIQDDCSSDATVAILKDYAGKDLRIQIFKNEKNLGYTKNFLSLLAKTKGEYIVFCDQDDVWVNNRLSYTLDFFTKHRDIGLFISNDLSFNEEKIPVVNKNAINSFYYSDFMDVLWSCSYKGCDMSLRKSVADKMLEIIPALGSVIAHDWLVLCYSYLHSKIAVDNKVLLLHRIHGDNTSRKEIEGVDARQARINGIDKQLKHLYWFKDSFCHTLSPVDNKGLSKYLRMMEQRKHIISFNCSYAGYIPLLLKWCKNKKIQKRLFGDIIYTFRDRKCSNL
jgi:glycosyltransferase involved in cell wall biosynthesis